MIAAGAKMFPSSADQEARLNGGLPVICRS